MPDCLALSIFLFTPFAPCHSSHRIFHLIPSPPHFYDDANVRTLKWGPMLARVQSCGVLGIDGFPIAVEIDHRYGEARINVVGLPDAAVKESRDRVYSAVQNSGFRFPKGVVTISLAPANVRKEGSALDLPIGIGMLVTTEQLSGNRFTEFALTGELALDGSLRRVAGALSMAIAVRDMGLKGIVLPEANADEAGVVDGIDVIPVRSLEEAAAFMGGQIDIPPRKTDVTEIFSQARTTALDLNEVKGQASAKRAITVAAAGGHNLLMIGPPGTGKTMLASRLPGILPDMTFEESMETTRIFSASDISNHRAALVAQRPFRAPHHTATTVSICGGGGGAQPFPGEVSLAHNGVLFLDELPEFNRSALEVLRQPLEDGLVHIRRANYSVTYPSRFMLVVAMNPCPCGCKSDPRRQCRCSQGDVQRYMARLSGPLLDRIDLHTEVPALSFEELANSKSSGPSTSEVRTEVQRARTTQQARYKGAFTCNAHLDARGVRQHCHVNDSAKGILEAAMNNLGLSARAYDKILRVARTLADLDNKEHIEDQHVAEAIQYRTLDRRFF
jgi:magnesium chelatase family protein